VLMVGSLSSRSIVSPQRPPSGASVRFSMGVSRCSSDYAGVQSVARLTVYIYIWRDLNNAFHIMM